MSKESGVAIKPGWWNCPPHTPESTYPTQLQPILFMQKFRSTIDKIFWLVFKKIQKFSFWCRIFQFLRQCVSQGKHFGRSCLVRLRLLVPICWPVIKKGKMLPKWHLWQIMNKYLAWRWSRCFHQSSSEICLSCWLWNNMIT